MQHPRSLSEVRRLRLASLLLLGNRLLILTAGCLLLVSFFANDQNLMVYGPILAGISLLLMVAQRIAASHAGCPLCSTPALAPMIWRKHRKARRLLGSYRLRVALCIMFKERFRCPYCNKHTAMEVMKKISGSRRRASGTNDLPKGYGDGQR